MKVLYLAFVDFKDASYGPAKKILSACKALEALNHDVTIIGRNGNSTVCMHSQHVECLGRHQQYKIGKFQTLLDKSAQIRDLSKYIKQNMFDICYIRYDLCTLEFLKLLSLLHRHVRRIVVEVATYPYNKEYSGVIGGLRLSYDRILGPVMKKYVDRIISFYPVPNNTFFSIPVVTVPNGFDFDSVQMIKNDIVPYDIDIAAVSTMRHWHAYERIINGLGNYYEANRTNPNCRKVILHLVGKGPDEKKYKELVTSRAIENYVIFHGSKSGKELDDILEKCELGLDSLGRHRTEINVLSSLKSREYGAKGLPIINSCKIDIIDSEFQYFLQVPSDESDVNVQSIIDFYDRSFAEKSRLLVAKKIRTYMECKCDMVSVMKRAIGGLMDEP